MKDRHEPISVVQYPLSAQGGNARLVEDGLTGYVSCQQDHVRVYQANDLKYIWAVILDLLIVGLSK